MYQQVDAPPQDVGFKPQPKQEAFLSSPADIVVYGGAAGGGKTWSLLVEPLRHIGNPNFSAVLFRESLSEAQEPGSVWDESKTIYPHFDGSPREDRLWWRFPSGARMTFGYMKQDKDKKRWLSSQITLLMVDQLENLKEPHWWFLLTRNRSTCGVKPYVRATANPKPGWLADFIDWWIADDGYADLSRSGVIRWFYRDGEKWAWYDTEEEALAAAPEGTIPKSFTFIVSTLWDNKKLMDADPGYLGNMQLQSYVDRERFLGDKERGGNWKVKEEAGTVFNRAWFRMNTFPFKLERLVRFFDVAATKSAKADFLAGALLGMGQGSYEVVDIRKVRVDPAEVIDHIVKVARLDQRVFGHLDYMVCWEEEPGAESKVFSHMLAKELAGINFKALRSTKNKLARANPLAAQVYAKNVWVRQEMWTEDFLTHMHAQPDAEHDDVMDATAGAYNEIAVARTVSPLKPIAQNWIADKRTKDIPDRMLRSIDKDKPNGHHRMGRENQRRNR